MSDLADTFQKRHQEKLEQLKRGPVDEAFLDGVTLLLGDLRQAGARVADPAERGQLRAWLRFWSNVAYDHRGVYPDTTLQPLDMTRVRPQEAPAHRPLPPLNWILAGGAAVIVIAAGLAAVGWLARRSAFVEATPAPTAIPVVSRTVVGTDTAEGVLIPADTFCAGTSEIVAQFVLDGIQPEMTWRWEVRRGDELVNSQPVGQWGDATHQTIPILVGRPSGVEPGQYNLLVYVEEWQIEARPFRVLDTPPRVTNPQVSDVPAPSEGAAEIVAGARVLYLTYEHEGMCPGLKVVHTLYRDGQPLQESVETWSGAPQGQKQVSFQAAGDQPFPPGDYEATVAVTGAEVARAPLLIQDSQAATMTPPPAFGNIVVALGAQPDGTPIITTPDNVFDWNTKVVYAVFDYTGMNDGTSWAAVWRRDGQEVARQEGFWDAESAGTQGRRWVTYYDPRGVVLPGGVYSVTLAVENVVQRSADFQILFYVPQETGGGQ